LSETLDIGAACDENTGHECPKTKVSAVERPSQGPCHRVEKRLEIWRIVGSLAVAAPLAVVRLGREFFITIGGPQVHGHSFENQDI
jgi:hypothetical protein